MSIALLITSLAAFQAALGCFLIADLDAGRFGGSFYRARR